MCSFDAPGRPAPGEADDVAECEAAGLEAESLLLQAVTAPAVKVSKARADRTRYVGRRRLRGVRDMTNPSVTEDAVVPLESHHSVTWVTTESGWHVYGRCR
ncbi:hypothetical protein GCM10027162_00950 [Streptomyces incanus]